MFYEYDFIENILVYFKWWKSEVQILVFVMMLSNCFDLVNVFMYIIKWN